MVADQQNTQNKLSLRVLRRMLLLFFFILLVTQVARLWNYFNTGADQSEILFRSLQEIQKTSSIVEWADVQPEGAHLDTYSRQLIGDRYGEAWQAWNNAISLHRTTFLKDYFTDSLAHRIAQINLQLNIQRAVVVHHLVPLLYSQDKQFVLFEDHQEEVIREVYKDGELLFRDQRSAVFRGIMTLEEGRWMIRYLKKIDNNLGSKNDLAHASRTDTSNFRADQIATPPTFSKGINYYPRKQPWTGFWEYYDQDTTARDLGLIKELGFDAVRFFIPYFDSRDPDLRTNMTQHLSHFLDIAKKFELKVIPTLFDFPKSYELSDYPEFSHYLMQILEVLQPYAPNVLVDIKNEADLDFPVYGREKVLRWLSFIIDQSRKDFPSLPITIGWSDPEMGHLLHDQLNVVSFHYYKSPDQYVVEVEALKSSLPPGTALMLSEFGRSTYNPFWFPFGNTPLEQATYVDSILRQSSLLNLPTVVWCLYDYPELPPGIFGWKPWIRGTQSQYGIIDGYRIKKPAAVLFQE